MGTRTFTMGPAAKCVCGKDSFLTRKDARTAKRRYGIRASDNHVYACLINEGVFHLGHLPADVINGTVTRAEAYSMDDAEKWAREAVALRAHRLCEVCGGRGQDFSHRRTKSVHDEHTWCPCNALFACRSCHSTMHDGPVAARREGLHVSRFIDLPGTVPALLSVGWAILDCEGGGRVIPAEQVIDEYGTPRVLGPGESNK